MRRLFLVVRSIGWLRKSRKEFRSVTNLFPFETLFPTLSPIGILTLRYEFGAINGVLLATLENSSINSLIDLR